jgi:hypothetical protein
MTISRIVFLARYRVPHACFALQFDHYLQNIDRTVIASPVPQAELWPVFERYGIDTSRFDYVNDEVIYQHYPEVNNWVFEGDYRGWWLRQQAIKLAYLDYINHDVMLMHDVDTFMIQPYQCYRDNRLNLMALENTVQGSYNGVFEAITGIPHPSPHCFVTELCAVRGQDMQSLKKHIQSRWPNKKWLDAIIEAVPGMPTVPPWGNGNIIKWFSEYELLGNWAVLQGNVDYQWQRRYEYSSLDQLTGWGNEHNAVCDAIPDLSLSMQYDWDQHVIPNYDAMLAAVKSKL